MSFTGGLFSRTLQDITDTKLHELSTKHDRFENYKDQLVAAVDREESGLEELQVLSDGVKSCLDVGIDKGRVVRGSTNNPRLEIDLRNLDRFIAQAKYDPSISSAILAQWKTSLFRYLEVQSTKFSFARLYGQLTTEWLSSSQRPTVVGADEDVDMQDYEHVSGRKKLECRKQWERSVFQITPVNRNALSKLLHATFEATPDDSKALIRATEKLRERVHKHEQDMMKPGAFNTSTLHWAMSGLLSSDLLTEEKRGVLRDFMSSATILNEIADVLNMRMAALDSWSWGTAVSVEQRRQLNGTYSVYMDEEILQAVFLQYIGVKWSVFFKQAFSIFRKTQGVWKTPWLSVPSLDKKRREFYLGPMTQADSLACMKERMYRKKYFLYRLPDSVNQATTADEGNEEADFEETSIQYHDLSSKQNARKSAGGRGQARGGAKRYRQILADEPPEEEISAILDTDPDSVSPKNPMDAKQMLLHLLSTDVLIKTRIHGEITCFRSQIEDLYPSLPHATIETVLSFFGVSERWLKFFKTFVEAPLRFTDDVDSEPRKRKQGIPASHALSELFSEAVLFCLDFEINQSIGTDPLWRLSDDFWFWSAENAKCHQAWSTIQRFVETTGLSLNRARTGGARMLQNKDEPNQLISAEVGADLPDGQIRWGMLRFNPFNGRFEIDQQMVDKHIAELGRQLQSKESSVFAWIQAWNIYASTFFTSNFGKPANCFGRQHVDNMLETHQRIQHGIFTSPAGDAPTATSVLDYLRQTFASRFSATDIPDGYIFFPTELGGLDVHSPFIGLLQIRDAVVAEPQKILNDFFDAEKEAYRRDKHDFESDATQHPHSEMIDPKFKPEDPDSFMSFAEWSRYREELPSGHDGLLADVWEDLLKQPELESTEADEDGHMVAALNALGARPELQCVKGNWHSMEAYWKWVVMLYGPEILQRFDGLGIVETGLLPLGLVKERGRVGWKE